MFCARKRHFKIKLNCNKGKQKPLTVAESVTNAVTQAKKETNYDENRYEPDCKL